MNSTFSISRIGFLLRKQTAEHYKGYLMALAVIAGALILWICFGSIMDGQPMPLNAQYVTFSISFLFGGTLFTAAIFSEYGESKSAVAAITLPASVLEKYFVKWLYSFVIFQVVFVGLFYIIMVPVQGMFSLHTRHREVINIFTNADIGGVFLSFIPLHALAFLGAILFKKLHFIKSAFAVLVIIIALVVINKYVMQFLLGTSVIDAIPFGSIGILDGKKYQRVALNQGGANTLQYLYCFTLTIILWAAAFFRLKEKQV